MFKQRRPSKSYNLNNLEALADAAIAQEEAGEEEDRSMKGSASSGLLGSRRRGKSNPDLLSLGSAKSGSSHAPPFRRNNTDEVAMARRARRRRSSNNNLKAMVKRTTSNPDSLGRARAFVKRTVSNSSERSHDGSSRSGANATWDTANARRRPSGSGRGGIIRQLSANSLSGLLKTTSMDASTPNASSSSLNRMANDMLRSTVMAPVTIAKTVVHAGSVASDAALSAGTMASDAALSAGSTVVYGGKSMVKAGKRASAKGLSLGADMMKRSMSMISYNSLYSKPKKSSWEEAIEAMDEILDPDCPAFQHMTPDQRAKMQGVRKLLIRGPKERNASKLQHVPAELILMQDELSIGQDNTTISASLAYNNDASALSSDGTMKSTAMASSHFILEEYAGVTRRNSLGRSILDSTALQQLQEEQEEPVSAPPTPPSEPERAAGRVGMDSPTASLTASDVTELSEDTDMAQVESEPKLESPPKEDGPFVPAEFKAMDLETQTRLLDALQWDTLNGWNFDVFKLDELTNGHAMLFAGWSILGAPHSQEAMAKHIGMEEPVSHGYSFIDELKIPPQKLYNFVKGIEQDYNASNPYHNAIHGADVLQSLHTLIQQSADLDFMKTCPKLQIFAILLSALVHDVSHFGTTNAFHNKLQTELSVLYNDKSVMESWHVAHAFSRMLDLDLSAIYRGPAREVSFSKFQQSKDLECNILCNTTQEQFQTIRHLMIDAILHTDMTNHFEMVNAARAMLMEGDVDDSSGGDSTWELLMFMLHMADVSGQAKGDPLFHKWRDLCFQEFFAQGDQEAALGLPISPNCDRNKVSLPDSQIGFIKFVVQPAFEVLGEFIPFVQDTVLPTIHSNMMYYVNLQELNEATKKDAPSKDDGEAVTANKQKAAEAETKPPQPTLSKEPLLENDKKQASMLDSSVSESSDDDSSIDDSSRLDSSRESC